MRPLRVLTLVVLAVVGLVGLAGGLALVTDPSGARLGLTVEQLPSWLLVDDYLIPGVALIAIFGLLPVAAAVLLVQRSARGWSITTAVGLLMVLWSGGVLATIGLAFPAVQTGFLIVGILLTGLGVDGGAVEGIGDESDAEVRSYEHADDES